MSEESREPGSVAGTAAEETNQAPAVGESAVTESATLVPGARKPEAADAEPTGVTGDAHAGVTADDHADVTTEEHAEPGEPGEPGGAEQEELERLRAEVRELREQGHGEGAAPRK